MLNLNYLLWHTQITSLLEQKNNNKRKIEFAQVADENPVEMLQVMNKWDIINANFDQDLPRLAV